jgi:hypothetical protein
MCPLATASGLIIVNVLFVAILFCVFKFALKVDFFLNLNKEMQFRTFFALKLFYYPFKINYLFITAAKKYSYRRVQ